MYVALNFYRQETYTWVDTSGRSCSPPPSETDLHNTLRSSVSRRSGMTLISNQDERKVMSQQLLCQGILVDWIIVMKQELSSD